MSMVVQELPTDADAPQRSQWATRYSEVVKAVRKGKLPKVAEMKCERCGAQAVHKHHDDYSKPLEVMYLCIACHTQRHKELGWGIRGRRRLFDFSQLDIGTYGQIEGYTLTQVKCAAWNHTRREGGSFKVFECDGKIIAFRTA